MYRIFYRKNTLSKMNGSWAFSPSGELHQDVEASSKKEAVTEFKNCMRVVSGGSDYTITRCEEIVEKEN